MGNNQSSKSDSPKAGPLSHSSPLLSENKNKISPRQWLCLWRALGWSLLSACQHREGERQTQGGLSVIWKKPWWSPLAINTGCLGAPFRDLFNTIVTLSLLAKGCQQDLKELTCPLNGPTGQWKLPSARSRSGRFFQMATRSETALLRSARATCRCTDLCKNGPEQQGTEDLKRQPLRSCPPWPLGILNISTFRSKSKTGSKQTEASTWGQSFEIGPPGHPSQA